MLSKFFLLYLGMDTDFILSLIGQATDMIMIIWEYGCSFFLAILFLCSLSLYFPKNALVINDRGLLIKPMF